MDVVNIASTALMSQVAQTQDKIATSMLKAAADQQNALADMLAQNAAQAPQPSADPSYNFSTYA